MSNKELSMRDIICETHIGLERQGPGSAETILKALSFIDNISGGLNIADLGCGTGGPMLFLAQHTKGSITGLDMFPEFIDTLNLNAEKLGLQNRVAGVIGSMEELPFEKEAFDLIWSEGAVDSIGFEKGISHWHGFLKKNGHLAVTCPSWIADEHPREVEQFWIDAGSRLDTIQNYISIMQKTGYSPIAVFVLPETDWTDNYFIPRKAAEKALLEKYAGNEIVAEYIKGDEYEAALYAKYKQFYGYVFYIGKKM